jgi:hypothetical protein
MVVGTAPALDDVELIEFHDAVVERVEMTRSGTVRIEFSHLPVYRRETPDTCGVWSFHAELRLVGIESFNASGITPRHEADSLEDLEVLGSDGRRLDPTALLKGGSRVVAVELTWALSGATAVFRGGSLALTLLEPLRRVETWTGELDPE